MKHHNSYVLATSAKAAQNLDTQHELMSATAYEQLIKAGLKKGMVVWDVGCGSGAMTEYLARQVGEEGHVYALDVSQEQLTRTQERLHQLGFKNISFICGDITALENFPKSKADLVYARMVLMHLREPEMALQKMAQLLKPSGMLSLQESTMETAGTPIDFFENSTAVANCYVAPVLASSSTSCTLRVCAPEAPGTSSTAASFERSLAAHVVVNDYFQTLIALGNVNGVDFNIDVLEHYTTKEHLDPVATGEKLLSRLEEWEGRALEAKLMTLEQLQHWKKELEKLSEKSPSNFFHIAEQTHVLARSL